MGNRYFVLATAMAVGAVLADELLLNCGSDCDPWNSQSGGSWIQNQVNAGTINVSINDTVLLTSNATTSLYPYNYAWNYGRWVQSGTPRSGGGGGGGGYGGGSGGIGGIGGGTGGSGGGFPPGTFCLDDGSNCGGSAV